MDRSERASARRSAALIVTIAFAIAAGLHCTAGGATVGANAASDAAAGAANSEATADGAIAPGDDGSLSSSLHPDAGSQDVASASDSAALSDASDGAAGPMPAGDAGVGAVWATWPMPNSPSSGLPHPQSYDTSVAGTALDRVTGLRWQRDVSIVSTAQQASVTTVLAQATSYCSGLTLGGFEDWRLPSRIELVSLLDFTVTSGDSGSVFTAATSASFVSSSTHALGTATAVVGVVHAGGTAGSNGLTADVTYLNPYGGNLQGPSAVRCVRGHGPATGPHYTVANGTIRDNWTGLTWIQSPSSSPMLPSTVGSYCAGQSLDGGGWRAPSVNELETLWGDFSSPDSVAFDPDTFGAAIQDTSSRLGSSNSYAGSATEWVFVLNAQTSEQADVLPDPFPLAGEPPAMEYWSYALCVR
jgi:hypothetical protein